MTCNTTPPDPNNEDPQDQGSRPKAGSSPNTATRLVSLVLRADAELFHDQRGTAYAALQIGGHRETLDLKFSGFRQWLARQCLQEYEVIPDPSALEGAVNTLVGRAVYDGPEREVHVRLAGHEGRIYLDLGDADWRAVEVDVDGWRVVACPPVYFRRPSGMRPLPAPVPGGRLDDLRQTLNVGDDGNWRMILAWLLGTLRASGPYAVLVLHGEQGSAKSTTAEGLRHLVDPKTPLLRAAPRSEQDLAIAAQNGWVTAYDNLSEVRPWLGDALCRLATGAGFGTRKLYGNEEEVLFDVARPLLLNGIAPEMISRPDLLDRALVVELPAITEGRRRTKEEVWQELEEARPRLLGALLDVVASGLRNLPTTRPAELPRMADFTRWVEACAPALGWQPGEFTTSLFQLRDEADAQALGQWSVYPYLLRMLGDAPVLVGTVAQLLKALNALRRSERDYDVGDWPRTAKALGGELRRYAPNLARVGVEVRHLGRSRDGSRIRLTRTSVESSAAPGQAAA